MSEQPNRSATRPDTVDCTGQRCPLPVLALARWALDRPAGSLVRVIADDPAAATDIPAWCRLRAHNYLGATSVNGRPAYDVRVERATGQS